MKDFLTVKDVAGELQISERKVRELFNKNKIPGKKVAGKYLTTRDLLRKYIEKEE
jgi:excisionase family DNA binding protein